MDPLSAHLISMENMDQQVTERQETVILEATNSVSPWLGLWATMLSIVIASATLTCLRFCFRPKKQGIVRHKPNQVLDNVIYLCLFQRFLAYLIHSLTLTRQRQIQIQKQIQRHCQIQ